MLFKRLLRPLPYIVFALQHTCQFSSLDLEFHFATYAAALRGDQLLQFVKRGYHFGITACSGILTEYTKGRSVCNSSVCEFRDATATGCNRCYHHCSKPCSYSYPNKWYTCMGFHYFCSCSYSVSCRLCS